MERWLFYCVGIWCGGFSVVQPSLHAFVRAFVYALVIFVIIMVTRYIFMGRDAFRWD